MATYGGWYSTLQDLSFLRLLSALDSQDGTSSQNDLRIFARESKPNTNIRIRIIVLAVILIVVGLIPALWKLLREFGRMVSFRQRWLEVRCGNQDIGWLSINKAPGFTGWGEKRLKDFITQVGLSSTLDQSNDRTGSRDHRQGYGARQQRSEETPLNEEGRNLEVDILKLFTIR
jgi:hypothetical protein